MDAKNHELRDGKYVAKIVSIEETKSPSGMAVVEWLLRIVDGEFAQKEVPKKYHLSNKKAVGFLKRELKTIGLDVKNGVDFEEKKDAAVGTLIRFEAITREDGWQCLYVKGVADGEDGGMEDIGW